MITAIIEGVKTVASIFRLWQEKKKVVAEGNVKVAQAEVEGKVKRAQTITEGEMDYDKTALEGMRHSWKDEWLTLLLSGPFIMCFIPPLAPYVEEGFRILKDSTPEWYQWSFVGIIIASFGLKGWLKWRNGK